MTPATIRDVPALAWLVASRSVSGTPGALTKIALLPVALLLVYGLPPFLHHGVRQSAEVLSEPLRMVDVVSGTTARNLILAALSHAGFGHWITEILETGGGISLVNLGPIFSWPETLPEGP